MPRGEPRAADVRIGLLSGYRDVAGSREIENDRWHLRKAASLVKLLALTPGTVSTGNRILRNSICENGRLGIELGLVEDGPTPKDKKDPSTAVAE